MVFAGFVRFEEHYVQMEKAWQGVRSPRFEDG